MRSKKSSRRRESRRPQTRKVPGPKPSITLPLVQRVAARIGRGLTLRLALAAEQNDKVNEETWKKALAAHPEFSPLYEAAKGKFLDVATQRLAKSADLYNLRWLLERRHADLFARPAEVSVSVENNVAVSIPDDVIQRARQIAKEKSGK